MASDSVPAKHALLIAGLSFAVGVFVGYKMKTYRLRYLQWKKQKLLTQLNKTCEDINIAVT